MTSCSCLGSVSLLSIKLPPYFFIDQTHRSSLGHSSEGVNCGAFACISKSRLGSFEANHLDAPALFFGTLGQTFIIEALQCLREPSATSMPACIHGLAGH